MDLDPAKLVDHVNDARAFELPFHIEVALPKVFGLQLTKFMVLELVIALLMVAVFVPLGRKLASGRPPKGRIGNLFDILILFIRDEMVRPAIGHHDADRFLPLILTLFFFILSCNLIGLLPWLGSPTASISVTAPLALITFLAGIGSGMKKFGAVGFWLGLCPPMDVPLPLKIVLWPLILVLEIMGTLIRYGILALRLLANMFAGHLGFIMIVGFIPAMVGSWLWYGVTPLAVLGGTAVSLLEVVFALLQAYIFAFLASIFIGMLVHQH
jgi:F-type H+-transporting ATPase subunit a